MSAPRATSYRIDPSIKARLGAQAATEHTTERALLEQLVAEGLGTLDHPGIVFRDGHTGRRAALAVGPDVWEVISALRSTTGTPEQRVHMLAEQSDLHPRHIHTAIDYAAVHRDASTRRIAANDEAAHRTAHAAQARDDLMAA